MSSMKRIVALVIALLMVLGTFAGALSLLASAADYRVEVVDYGSPSYCLDADNPVYVDLNRIKNTGYYYKIENMKLKLTLGSSVIDSISTVECRGGNLQVSSNYDNSAVSKRWNRNQQELTLTMDHLLYDGNGTSMDLTIVCNVEGAGSQEVMRFSLQLPYLEAASSSSSGSNRYDTDDPVSVLTPRIIVNQYTHTGAVREGSEFTVSLHYGTKSDLILKNIMLEVAPPSGVAIKNTSNKAYIDQLTDVSPQKSSFTFLVSDDYQADTVPLTVSFDFEYWLDGVYTKGSSSEILSLAVDGRSAAQTDRFELSTLTLPENLFAGEEGWLTLNVINKGKEQASNVSVRLAGEGLSNNGYEEYHGAVASNTKAEIELPISASAGGEYACQLIVTYENSKEELKELVKDFTLTVQELDQNMMNPGFMEDPMGGMGNMEPEPASPGFPLWGWITIGAGVVLAVIVAAVVVKKRRAKRLEVEDEDN